MADWRPPDDHLFLQFAIRNDDTQNFTLGAHSWEASLVPWNRGAPPNSFNISRSTYGGKELDSWALLTVYVDVTEPTVIPSATTCLVQSWTGIWNGTAPPAKDAPERVLVAVELPRYNAEPLRGSVVVSVDKNQEPDQEYFPFCSEVNS
jgi:hypothetical protein